MCSCCSEFTKIIPSQFEQFFRTFFRAIFAHLFRIFFLAEFAHFFSFSVKVTCGFLQPREGIVRIQYV